MLYAIIPRAAAIRTEGRIARPSSPSVKFTAFDDPTNTNIPKEINKTGLIGTIRSLKKGTINAVSGMVSAEKNR